ncbi:MAG: aminoacyl-tRNA hydrolase [Candidatus Doudnabacteria bacterium]
MKIIAGLGNPGIQYKNTRHNAGFMAIDHFLKGKATIACQSKFKAQICELHFGSTKVFFVKPQSYMNLSGQALTEIMQYYKVNPTEDLMVIHDDKDLPFGQVKLTNNSGSAGHNGIKDILAKLGTQEFERVRIGIESRPSDTPIDTADFVLQKFTDEELNTLNQNILPSIDNLIEEFLAK